MVCSHYSLCNASLFGRKASEFNICHLYGISFQGVIVVHEVYDQGAAARDARLQTGDQILSVSSILTLGLQVTSTFFKVFSSYLYN